MYSTVGSVGVGILVSEAPSRSRCNRWQGKGGTMLVLGVNMMGAQGIANILAL